MDSHAPQGWAYSALMDSQPGRVGKLRPQPMGLAVSGEEILTIAEYLPNGSEVPLKHINLKNVIKPNSVILFLDDCTMSGLSLIKDMFAYDNIQKYCRW